MQNMSTPKSQCGMQMDTQQSLKYLSKIEKVLQLRVESEEPKYDDEGKPIIDEEEAMLSTPFHLKGIFNAELLADDYGEEQNRSSQGSNEYQHEQ